MTEDLSDNLEDMVNGEVRVTLQVFSGRQDPSWKLSKKKISELKKQLKNYRQLTDEQTNKLPGLGYKGFLIESKAVKGVPKSALVYANPRSLEKWLLDSSEDKLLSVDFPNLDMDLKNYVRGQLYKNPW